MTRTKMWLVGALAVVGCDDGGGAAADPADMAVVDTADAAGGGGGTGGVGGSDDMGAGGAGGAGGGSACTPGTTYAPGTPMFVERTEEWGLRTLGVQGVMLTVADVDGDGWADLVARRGGVRADLYAPTVPGRIALHWNWRDVDTNELHRITTSEWRIGGGEDAPTWTIDRFDNEAGTAVAADADGTFTRFDWRMEGELAHVCEVVTGAADAAAAEAAAGGVDDCAGRAWRLYPTGRNHWLLRNTGAGHFEDVTRSSGLYRPRGTYPDVEISHPAWVTAFGDVDNDGDLDAYNGFDTREPVTVTDPDLGPVAVRETSELYLNDGTGRFAPADQSVALRREGLEDVPAGASFTDFDRDGNLDLWLAQGGLGAPLQDRLYRGTGDTAFTDVTALAGLESLPWEGETTIEQINEGLGHSQAWSSTACDLDDDGAPELMASSYGRAPNLLWQSGQTGNLTTYTNVSVASGYAYDDNFDWTGDQFARCYCASNRAAEGCADVPNPQVQCGQPNWNHDFGREAFRLGGNSGGTTCADFDGDGRLDLYTTEIKHWWAGPGADGGEVLLNRTEPGGPVVLDRVGREALGMVIDHPAANWDEGHITAGVIDVDNDGRQDIYVGATDYAGNRGRLYVNRSTPGAPGFVEVPTADFFEHNRSHGMAVADFDHDGDLDLIVGHSRARCDANASHNCYPTQTMRYFENVVGDAGNWFQLDLRGVEGTNRLAVGARVTVRTADGWTQVQEVNGGFGHFGAQMDRVLHFGLGANCEAEVTVRWPNAALSTQTFTLGTGRRYQVVQGGSPTPVP